MFNKFLALAMTGLLTASGTAVLSTLSIVSTPLTPSANAQVPPQKYKVTFRYVINQSNDGPFDNTLELYGDINVGGKPVKTPITRNAPVSRERSNTLEMGSVITTNPSIIVSASLMDRDQATPDDPVFVLNNYTLSNLAAKAGGSATTKYWSSGQGEAATLYMFVERVP